MWSSHLGDFTAVISLPIETGVCTGGPANPGASVLVISSQTLLGGRGGIQPPGPIYSSAEPPVCRQCPAAVLRGVLPDPELCE